MELMIQKYPSTRPIQYLATKASEDVPLFDTLCMYAVLCLS